MFTGIIEELGRWRAWSRARRERDCACLPRGARGIAFEGASIAVNGVCLTAVDLRAGSFSADLAPETLRRTNLGDLRPGSRVNLERPMSPGGG